MHEYTGSYIREKIRIKQEKRRQKRIEILKIYGMFLIIAVLYAVGSHF